MRCMNGSKGVGSVKADLGTISGIRIFLKQMAMEKISIEHDDDGGAQAQKEVQN
jgi:hypothetical protein